MTTMNVKIKVGPDVDALLKRHMNLAPDAIQRGMNYIAITGEKSVKKRIVQLGLVKTGKLGKSVTGEVVQLGKAIIGASAWYAHFLEGGTQAHQLPKRPHRRKKKAITFPGAEHPVRVTKHPGTKATRFLEGTIEGMYQSNELESLFSRGVREAIEKLGGANG